MSDMSDIKPTDFEKRILVALLTGPRNYNDRARRQLERLRDAGLLTFENNTLPISQSGFLVRLTATLTEAGRALAAKLKPDVDAKNEARIEREKNEWRR